MSLVTISTPESKLKDEILELQEVFTTFDKMGEGSSGNVTQDKLADVLREYLVK
jgi:hypothetical protein